MNSDINYIIQESLKGDKYYQEILLKRLNPLIYKNIYLYYHPSNPLIEDLAQEGYIIILQSLKDYDEKRNIHFLQYIKIKLYYYYKNYSKKHLHYNYKTLSIGKLREKGNELKSNNLSQLDIIIKKEERDLLYKCLNKITNKEQEVLRLFYFQQYSIQEISQELNLKYRAVINIKSNAIKKLRKMMEK
jgi:RNA polymerase sporulation-specific sigma factor